MELYGSYDNAGRHRRTRKWQGIAKHQAVHEAEKNLQVIQEEEQRRFMSSKTKADQLKAQLGRRYSQGV